MSTSTSYPRGLPASHDEQTRLVQRLQFLGKEARPHELKQLTLSEAVDSDNHAPPEAYLPENRDYARCQRPCGHFQWPLPRPRADLVLEKVTDLEPLAVTLPWTPAGEVYRAQVYKGQVIAKDGGLVTVVVKLFQGSMTIRGQSMAQTIKKDKLADDLMHWTQESWSYYYMRDLQGIVVPHVYGFFEVTLPNTEKAIAMVMEYIDATQPVPQLAVTPIEDNAAFTALALGLSAAVHAVSICGVAHCDLTRSNMIWDARNQVRVPAGELSNSQERTVPFPILLDFSFVQPLVGLPVQPMDGSFKRALETLCEYGVYEDVLLSWWNEVFVDGRSLLARLFDAGANMWAVYAKQVPRWRGVQKRAG